MAVKKLLADLAIISKLSDNPGVDDGLSSAELRAKFDEAALLIQDYLNNHLIPEFDKIVDVEALLADVLDATLSKSDKAANAKATGDAIRGLRSFFEKVVHGGDYVLESDGCFAAEISGDATVRISGGEGVIQGNLFDLNLYDYEDVFLTDGDYGLCRNDLIVIRCTKDDVGVLSYSLVGLTGTRTSGEPADPEYEQGDINADASVHDFPLYRVRFDGVDIVETIALFEVQKPLEQHILDCINKHADNTHLEATATLTANDWEGDAAPYTQTIGIEGVLETDNPHVFPVYDEDKDTRTAQKEAWAMVVCGKTGDGTIVFTCDEDKPTTAIPIQIEVNR